MNFRKSMIIFNVKGLFMQIVKFICDILELYSSLVTFYHNVYYKQRKNRSYGKVE